MTEDQNFPPPSTPPPPPVTPGSPAPQPPQPEQAPEQEASLQEELARSRRKNKWLVAVAVVLGTIFVIAGGAVYIIYSRLSEAKENFEEVFRAMPMQQPAHSGPGDVMGQDPGSRLRPSPQSSSLAMFASSVRSGGQAAGPAVMAMNPQQSAQMLKAMSKYAERPIVKEFLSDLRKDPDIAAAFKAKDEGNPLAVLAYVQKSKGMDALVAKYATRPEFLGLMMEVMADPEMQPYLNKMPMPGMMPAGGEEEARPVGVPQPQYRPVTARPGDEDGDGELRMDPGAMQVPKGHKAGGAPIDEVDTE